MPSCEKCWWDASLISRETGEDRIECYHRLLKERNNNPCSPKEQAGQWWDEEKQIDRRFIK